MSTTTIREDWNLPLGARGLPARERDPHDNLPRSLVAIALFVAISALGGGVASIADRAGTVGLEHTPFRSLVIPGLVLVIAVGGTSLASAILTWRRSRSQSMPRSSRAPRSWCASSPSSRCSARRAGSSSSTARSGSRCSHLPRG